MSVINTNVNSLKGISLLYSNNLAIKDSLEKLTTGFKINKAADNPSDLAITTGMQAQIRGTAAAIHNTEDALNLLYTADGAMAETVEIMQRIRELALKGANEAVIVHSTAGQVESDGLKLAQEMRALFNELDRKFVAVSFNTKKILSDGLDPASNPALATPTIQVGPDNDSSMTITFVVSNLQVKQFSYQAGSQDVQNLGTINSARSGGLVSDYLAAANKNTFMQGVVDYATSALNHYSNVRSELGVIARRLRHIVADNTIMNINISQAKSRIHDTDFAREISEYTKLQILMQSGTAILGQVNAQPQSVLQLLQ